MKKDKAKYWATCPRQYDRCMLYSTIKDSAEVAFRACADKWLCDTTKQTCNASYPVGQCAVNCCDTDECNLGSTVTVRVSVLLVVICSVMGLALLYEEL